MDRNDLNKVSSSFLSVKKYIIIALNALQKLK